MQNVTVLVNSCDKYEDVWEPFFTILKKQWPECEQYQIVLNTEEKVYNCDFMNITTICGGKGKTWSQRLKYVLGQIESDYILYFLEDFFLLEKVNNETLQEALALIQSDNSIGYIGLKYQKERNYRDPALIDNSVRFINKDNVITVNRINSMTALWNKQWLVSLLRDHETPWEFELYGSVRSKRDPNKVLVINNADGCCPCVFNYQVDAEYGYSLQGGKWLPKCIDLIESYGLKVNFDNLGIDYDRYYTAIGQPVEKPQITNDANKMNPREILYKIKHSLKVLNKKRIKAKRKRMSLK